MANETKVIRLAKLLKIGFEMSKDFPPIQVVRCQATGCEHNEKSTADLPVPQCCGLGKGEEVINIGTGGVCLSFKSKEGGEHGE